MIFPDQCKYIGYASAAPCGEKVYFLSRYLVHPTEVGFEIIEIRTDPEEKGSMRRIVSSRVIASADEVYRYPNKVQIHDRTLLIQLALESGYRCTLFCGLDEHMTFVLDPDRSGLTEIHVYDTSPPRPSLSACLRELEVNGLFGESGISFSHHILDLTELKADVFPCRAAGFSRTLDADVMHGGERIAGCMTGSNLVNECYGTRFELQNICPLAAVSEEPFIARCCRSERQGVGEYNGRHGAVVHWGASPRQIADAVFLLVEKWREHEKGGSR